jgi:hypothetical protein
VAYVKKILRGISREIGEQNCNAEDKQSRGEIFKQLV